MPSFDTVCEADMVEVKNAVDNTAKEIGTRFDFKGTSASIEFKDIGDKLRSLLASSDASLALYGAGDIDEAVAGLLTNGLAAGDVNGESVPAGFSRIDAFRVGVLGDAERCYKRFP